MNKRTIMPLACFSLALFLPLVTIEVKANNSNQSLYEMARQYELSGRSDKALGIYRLILNRDPNALEARKRLGLLGTTPLVQTSSQKTKEKTTKASIKRVTKTKLKSTSYTRSNERHYALQLATMNTKETSKAEELALKYSTQLGVKCYTQPSSVERTDGSRNVYIRCSSSKKRSEVEKVKKIATAKGLDSMVVNVTTSQAIGKISRTSAKATTGEAFKLYDGGKLQEAKQIFQQVLQVNSSDIDAHEGLGYVYLQQKEYDQCALNLQKRYDANPDLKTAQNLLECYAKGENPKLSDEFYKNLPSEIKATIRNPIVEEILKEVDHHIDRDELIFAVEKLDRLYRDAPSNTQVLLRYANLYMAKNEYAVAREYYQAVLDKEPTNAYAQEGIAGALMALGDYKGAIEAYEKLTANTDISQLYKAKMEYASKEKRYSDAAGYGEEYLKLEPDDIDIYLSLSTIYENLKQTNKAALMLDQASKIDNEAFKVTLARLYFMLTHGYYQQIVRSLETFEGVDLSTEDSNNLKAFYQAYYQKLSGERLQRKEYSDALIAAKSGLMMSRWDSALLNTAGWSAFNLHDYQAAEGYFSNLSDIDLKNYEAFYGLGMSFTALKRPDDAKKAFAYAEATMDQKLVTKLRDAYKQISYKEGFQRLSLRLRGSQKSFTGESQPDTRTVAPLDASSSSSTNRDLMNIYNPFLESIELEDSFTPALRRNPAVIEKEVPSVPKFDGYYSKNEIVPNTVATYDELPDELPTTQVSSSVSSGLFVKTRSGNQGVDGLRQTIIPVDMDLKWGDSHTLYADLNWVTLNSGVISPIDYSRFGMTGTTVAGSGSSDTQGLVPLIGYGHKGDAIDFDVHIGSTLRGGELNSVLTWGAGIRVHPEGKMEGYLKNEKISITDSLLSYAGANDPFVTGLQWGRVTKEGIKAGFKYQDSWTWALDLAHYYAIGGKNVMDNKESSVTAMVVKNLNGEDFSYFNVGPIVVMDSYAHNSNHFTYGHGGYFSPQRFLLVGLYADIAKVFNDDIFVRAKGNVGYLSFDEDSSPKFPLANGVFEYYPTNQVYTIGYDFKLFGGYRLDKHWDFLLGMGMQHSKEFDSSFVGASAVYYFDKHDAITLESLLRSNTLEKGLQ